MDKTTNQGMGSFEDTTKDIIGKALDTPGLSDLNLSEYASEILNRAESGSFADSLEETIQNNGTCANGLNPVGINTYPFGRPTDSVYSSYIGLCRNRHSNDWDKLLDNVLHQCECMAFARPNEREEKTVIVLTTIWDDKAYLRYKNELFTYCVKYNIMPIFFLVTDNGIVRIPIFVEERTELEFLRHHLEEIDYPFAISRVNGYTHRLIRDQLMRDPIDYEDVRPSAEGENRSHYHFDLKHGIWYRENRYGHEEGTLTKAEKRELEEAGIRFYGSTERKIPLDRSKYPTICIFGNEYNLSDDLENVIQEIITA